MYFSSWKLVQYSVWLLWLVLVSTVLLGSLLPVSSWAIQQTSRYWEDNFCQTTRNAPELDFNCWFESRTNKLSCLKKEATLHESCLAQTIFVIVLCTSSLVQHKTCNLGAIDILLFFVSNKATSRHQTIAIGLLTKQIKCSSLTQDLENRKHCRQRVQNS